MQEAHDALLAFRANAEASGLTTPYLDGLIARLRAPQYCTCGSMSPILPCHRYPPAQAIHCSICCSRQGIQGSYQG